MNWSRREFGVILPALLTALSASAHEHEQNQLSSKVYLFQDLPANHTKTLEFRPIVTGKTVDGCTVSVHESALAPHTEPHPPHHHDGEEMFLMLDGMLEVTIKGKSSRITRGSVAFIGSGDEHGIRNVGEIPARYYVVELGPQR